ncbi:MAG: CHAD domain-containing protein [Pirellulales bacterium]
MLRQSKWFAVENPDRPALAVGRACVRDRLRWVWRMLGRTALAAPGRTDEVHQLRVATRRATTALDLFGDMFAADDIAWVAKRLKKLRRAAGAARDRDVIHLHYAGLPDSARPPHGVLRKLAKRSEKARPEILELLKSLREKAFLTRAREALRKPLKTRAKLDFRAFAQKHFAGQWAIFVDASEGDLTSIDALHEFRLRTKSLRYALETLVAALPQSARETLYPRVTALQEALGEINDHAVALATLQEFAAAKRGKGKLARWAAAEIPTRRAALDTAHVAFLQRWPDLRRDLFADVASLGLEHDSAA